MYLTPNTPHTRISNHGDCLCLQWLVGNVVGRDDTLYARMKQRDLDGHDSMWEPIFVDDAAIGLDQKNRVNVKIILLHDTFFFTYDMLKNHPFLLENPLE